MTSAIDPSFIGPGNVDKSVMRLQFERARDEITAIQTLTESFNGNNTVFTQAGTGAVLRSVTSKLRDIFSIKDFGAVGNGVTSDHAAFVAALSAVNTAGQGSIYLPAGRYRIPNNIASLLLYSNLTIYGDGQASSVIVFDDTAQASRRDLFFRTDTVLSNITLRDFAIEGNCEADFTQRSHFVEIAQIDNLRVENVRFKGSRYMGFIASKCTEVVVTGCIFDKILADGLRLVDCTGVTVTSNTFRDVCDDAIAVHSADSTAAPVRASATIVGNTLIDCQGITAHGMKIATISNNTLTRPTVRGISVDPTGSGSPEGNTAIHSIVISGNVITDLMPGDIFSASSGGLLHGIDVASLPPTNGGSAPFVGHNNTATGTVLPPYNYMYTNDVTSASVKSPGNYGISITGNVVARTLPAVASYSVWGYGQRFSRTGYVNPAITEAHLSGAGYGGASIHAAEHVRGLLIANNTLSGRQKPIWLKRAGSASSTMVFFQGVVIKGNIMTDFARTAGDCGVHLNNNFNMVSIEGNIFDGDPYMLSPARSGNQGAWTSSSVTPAAVIGTNLAGFVSITGNHIRNVYQPTANLSGSASHISHNYIYGFWTSTTYSSSNKGIGAPSDSFASQYIAVYENSDPTQSAYGQTINGPDMRGNTMPTSGYYLTGHVVESVNVSVLGTAGSQYTLRGWLRLTTGNAHVLNTDWRELRVLTGT